MHKMRIWLLKMKGAYVSPSAGKMPLQNSLRTASLKETSFYNKDLAKWLGGPFIMLINKSIVLKITSNLCLLQSNRDE